MMGVMSFEEFSVAAANVTDEPCAVAFSEQAMLGLLDPSKLDKIREIALSPSSSIEESINASMVLFFSADFVGPEDRNAALSQLKVLARKPVARQMIYRTGRLRDLVPYLMDASVVETLASVLINMLYHDPSQETDSVGAPRSLYAEHLLTHGVATKMVAAAGDVTSGASDRARELLLMAMCNLSSHGPAYKDAICGARKLPSVLSRCLLSESQGVSDHATKLLNALCCENASLSLERVDKIAEGGVPAAVAALFLDGRSTASSSAAKIVPVLFSIFQQSHERFCAGFVSNGGEDGVAMMFDSLTTRKGSAKAGAEQVVKQLAGIRWWIDALRRPPQPILRAVVIMNRRRGAPPSYMSIKSALIAEFGEDAVAASRKEIQALLEKRHAEHGREVATVIGEYCPPCSPVMYGSSPDSDFYDAYAGGKRGNGGDNGDGDDDDGKDDNSSDGGKKKSPLRKRTGASRSKKPAKVTFSPAVDAAAAGPAAAAQHESETARSIAGGVTAAVLSTAVASACRLAVVGPAAAAVARESQQLDAVCNVTAACVAAAIRESTGGGPEAAADAACPTERGVSGAFDGGAGCGTVSDGVSDLSEADEEEDAYATPAW